VRHRHVSSRDATRSATYSATDSGTEPAAERPSILMRSILMRASILMRVAARCLMRVAARCFSSCGFEVAVERGG
jgi:hypothetical protein